MIVKIKPDAALAKSVSPVTEYPASVGYVRHVPMGIIESEYSIVHDDKTVVFKPEEVDIISGVAGEAVGK